MSLQKAILGAAVLAITIGLAAPASAQSCTADKDCPQSYSCVASGIVAPPPLPACPANADCAKLDVDGSAGQIVIMMCAPKPCSADADCGAGMVCYTDTTESCSGDGSAAPWMREVLLLLLRHPTSLSRANVPRGAERTRTALARRVAPFAHMTKPEHRTFDVTAPDRKSPDELIAEAALFLGNDEAEQTEIAQALDEFRRLRRVPVPALEILAPRREELIDRLEHHAEHFPVLLAQPRIGKEVVLDDAPRQQILRNTHGATYCAIRSMTSSRTPSWPTS